jgi:phenylacetate-CoA ligase
MRVKGTLALLEPEAIQSVPINIIKSMITGESSLNPLLTGREKLVYLALCLATRQNVLAQARAVRQRLEWSSIEIQAFQLTRFRELLSHANRKVPYYSRVLRQAGINPNSFASFSGMAKIPVLTRASLMDSFQELQDPSIPAKAVTRISSGGTTGKPVSVLHEKRRHLERMLVTHRSNAVAGRRLGSSTCEIAGRSIDYSAWTSNSERLKNLLFNVSIRPAFSLTAGQIAGILGEMTQGKWRTVLAYASVFDILCDHVCEHKMEVRVPRVIPCGELVTDTQKERWRHVLGTEVFEVYGSREMTSIAMETPDHRQLMVNGDQYYVEITDESGKPVPDGEPGLITITSLLEYAMPLIRYQLGDVGILGKPDPSETFPFRRLKVTHGRSVDIIKTPEGKLLPGEYFPHLFKEVVGQVERFQAVQTAVDKLVIKVVRKPGYSEKTEAYLVDKIHAQVSEGLNISFEYMNAIETSVSGKYRPTISLIRNRIM